MTMCVHWFDVTSCPRVCAPAGLATLRTTSATRRWSSSSSSKGSRAARRSKSRATSGTPFAPRWVRGAGPLVLLKKARKREIEMREEEGLGGEGRRRKKRSKICSRVRLIYTSRAAAVGGWRCARVFLWATSRCRHWGTSGRWWRPSRWRRKASSTWAWRRPRSLCKWRASWPRDACRRPRRSPKNSRWWCWWWGRGKGKEGGIPLARLTRPHGEAACFLLLAPLVRSFLFFRSIALPLVGSLISPFFLLSLSLRTILCEFSLSSTLKF